MAVASAAELEPVARVATRVKALLQHARSTKPETTIEPPLNATHLIEDIQALHDVFDGAYDQSYRFSAVETAFREIFYSLIHSTEIHDPAFGEVWNLLDVVLICGDEGRCDPGLVCWLIEELLDSQTTEGCRTVFDYLDSRRESRAEDAIFCGRVFFFLFQTFPLGDKSSVNLRGEFHTENTTKFEVSAPVEGEQMDVDFKTGETPSDTKESTPQPAAPTKPGSKAIPIKAAPKKVAEEEVLSTEQLYPIFWRLQHDFSDPTRLFDNDNFTVFKKGLACTIAKFKKTPTVVQTKSSVEGRRGTKRKMHGDGGEEESDNTLVDNYNPKYLTSRDLFGLELSDLAFQRHILVQALILIDFLLSLTEKAKKRLNAVSTNRALIHAFVLNEEDAKWATSTRSTITSHLNMSNEGRHYCRMVETVLARDKNWVRWKVESCPSIVRGPVSTEEELLARTGAAKFTRPRTIPDKPQNVMNLSFLDEVTGGGLDALKHPSRYTAPSIEQLVEQVKTDKLDAEMAMDEEEKSSYENAIQNAKWRALRQARATNLSLLDKVESTKDLEEIMSPPEQATENVEATENTGEDTNAPVLTIAAEEAEEATAVETEPVAVVSERESDKVMAEAEAA
ncbi:uncharacterized protein MYCFIDRAFT_42306 [Pseudocercospora fijiensis CIRAD86]|uniref:Nuclear matrix protein n=1 Tax=Pseudocercospora fijiensis (strain CIRAD86) TaxID=383855 RepID=M3AIW7_PSEFD|nr:uncharacterized protein MYCFIDRAFT_42306 [Pseudocercospora fijiensis CIRAD86]EME77417.1 hypothetical protein MYCFIDRAFT_42306 [Pseudocercospora fijiensis CIRAD86]